MKFKRLLLAFLCLLLPIGIRAFWYYRGLPNRNRQVEIPNYQEILILHPVLSTPLAETNQTNVSSHVKKRILFDFSHRNQFTYDEIESLRNNLIWRSAEVVSLEYEEDLAPQLTKADAFVILAPTSFYSPYEIELIEEFVHRGGRLLVVADPTRSFSEYESGREESVILTNEILQPFQLAFRNDYVYNLRINEGNFRNIFVQPAEEHSLSSGISELVFYTSHSLDSRATMVFTSSQGSQSSLEDREKTVSVASLDKSGDVLALGDMTFMTSPYNHIADNNLLIQNIADFLMNGSREIQLADFPNLFRRNIGIILNEDFELVAHLISIISDIKYQYAQDDIDVAIIESSSKDFDLIYLGTYPPDGDIKKISDQMGINFDSSSATTTPTVVPTRTPEPESEAEFDGYDSSSGLYESINSESQSNESYIYIPELGNIPAGKFGIVILNVDKNRVNLLLLGNSKENAVDLLAFLLNESLYNCLSTDFVAICEQDSFGSFYDDEYSEPLDSDWEELEYETDYLTPEPAFTQTPTPSSAPG